MMKANKKRGAVRKPVRKEIPEIAWRDWLRHGFVLTVLISITAGILWLKRDDNLPVLYVTVDGKFENVDKNKLVEAVTPHVTGNFINVDVSKLREAGEAAPWVKQIQVQRKWPDSIHLVVEEQEPIALWGKSALLNREGDLFYPSEINMNLKRRLVRLEGPDGTNKMMVHRYISMKEKLSAIGLSITKLKIDKRRSWLVSLSNDIALKLGRANSEERLARFIRVYHRGLSRFQNDIKMIDMRYTNGLSVNWKSGVQPEFNRAV